MGFTPHASPQPQPLEGIYTDSLCDAAACHSRSLKKITKSRFNTMTKNLKNTPSSTAKSAQIMGHKSYAIKSRNSDILAPLDSGMDGRFPKNSIRLRRTDHKCPSTWTEGSLTATQIIEGKTTKKVMRSQKLVLCKVEDDKRIWFEVAGLGDDLSYPFDSKLIGIRVFPFGSYREAKAQFVSLVNWAECASKKGTAA